MCTKQTEVISLCLFTMKKAMEKAYYTPAHPGSFGGVDRLRRAVQDETGQCVKREKVQEYLMGQDAYTLHQPARIKFPRNRVFVPQPLDQFQADLCDMQALAEYNDGFNYLITVIDVFSKKAYARVLKRKTADAVVKAFQSVLEESQIPRKLQTDAGKEFFNKSFQALMKKHNIVHFSTASDLKASVVERFNRTLKGRMWRYFTANNTRRYLDVLQDLLKSYNQGYHSSIKMKPDDVTLENTPQVFENLYGSTTVFKHKYKFAAGDTVRISKVRGVFDKKYEQSFTNEVFTITRRLPRSPPAYKLKDFDGEIIEGSFYEAELQKVKESKNKLYHVEEILKRRTFGGKKQVLVRWKNWPEKFNSWVDDDLLTNV
nr:uncharacterized protein LOC133574295 isoform X3 [Nerophis lumbriciformis]